MITKITSAKEGWQNIKDLAKAECQAEGFDEYSIKQVYKDFRMYAEVAFYKSNQAIDHLVYDVTDFGSTHEYMNKVYTKVTQQEQEVININDILKIEPTLTAFGITEHSDSLPELSEIQTCIDWLGKIQKTKGINRHSTSYGYKHEAERAYRTYVSNGAFIAAVIHLGIPYEKIPGSPNVYVALSRKR